MKFSPPKFTSAFLVTGSLLVGLGIGSVLTWRYLAPYIGQNSDSSLVSRNQTAPPPVPPPPPPVVSTAGWGKVTDSRFHLFMLVPPAWNQSLNDNDSGLTLALTASGGASGIVTVQAQDIGHGTPGPQVSQTSTTVGGQAATKTTWEGGGNRLVQYKFTNADLYYKFEMTAPISATATFSDFDASVQSFKFTD